MPHELLTPEIRERVARIIYDEWGVFVSFDAAPRASRDKAISTAMRALEAALPDLEAAWNRRAPLSDEQDITFGR